jgi:hypothetical protein
MQYGVRIRKAVSVKLLLVFLFPVVVASSAAALMVDGLVAPFATNGDAGATPDSTQSLSALAVPVAMGTAVALAGMAAALEKDAEAHAPIAPPVDPDAN